MRAYRVYTIAASIVLVTGLTGSTVSPAGAVPPSDVACIAHRGGVSTHTEETLPTFAENIAAGVTEVEGDIRYTRTGYPVMLHDAHLGKFGASSVDIVDLSVGQAKSYDSASGDVIATLYEIRTLLLANPTVRAQFELKVSMTPEMWDMLETRLDVLGNRVTLTSFSMTTVRQAQDRGYRTGFLSALPSITTGAPIFIQNWATVESSDVARHSGVGVKTQVYTPDTVSAWNEMASAGVSAIITNKPLDCMSWSAGTLRRK